MTGQFLPHARTLNLVVQEMDGELLLFDGAADRAHVLNKTAGLVWKFADGTRSVPQLAQRVARELHTAPDQDLIWLALRQLSKANLLERPAPVVPLTAHLSRREFLQKAAFAAMLIPVVKTISTPHVQQSASCLDNGSACTADEQCCGEVCADFQCTCFLAGTLVWFGDGTRRPIETVRVGDQVIARDEASGILAPQPVEKLYVHRDRQAFTLDFGASTLDLTATHPVYTDKGWVKAVDLRVGMDTYLQDGSRLTLREVRHEIPHPRTVYNLQVAGFHTYFVGAQGVWVHNRTTIRDIPTS